MNQPSNQDVPEHACGCSVGDLSGVTPIVSRKTKSPSSQTMHTDLPAAKQTALGLYVTAKEAYDMWQADPENLKILDVRTPEEFLFVGSPPMALRIPVATQSYQWDAEKKQYPMSPLPDFADRVKAVAKPEDTILVTCRSGGRSAIACNMLAKAGFTQVHNIVDGMEGDKNGDSNSKPVGGWKNSGCPWTKDLNPESMVLPQPQ